MSDCCRKIIISFFVLLAGALSGHAQPSVPSYQIGETARVEVVATVSFVAIDPVKTEALKQKEAQRHAVIYRFDTNALQDALFQLQESFATNRQNFMVELQARFNRSTMSERAMTDPAFSRLIARFQSANKGFPFSSNLARVWAKGESDVEFITPLEQKLAATMSGYIRLPGRPPEAKIGNQVKLVPSDRTSALLPLEVERARVRTDTNVVSLEIYRGEVEKRFPPEEKTVARYIISFIQPTCFPEVAITHELREKKSRDLSSVNRYEAGDVIVRAGEVVTAGSKAALDEFRGRLALLRGSPAPQAPATTSPTPWLVAGATALCVLAGAVVFWMRSRRRMLALDVVPESLGQDAVVALRNDPVIRARLTEHLTRLLGHSLVRRLFAQRGQLLNTQQAAAVQTAELEERLEKVQTDVQERFVAYEQRIADLEKELAAAEEQNRDIIRAKIVLVKQELEAERARGGVNWN